tara:strand:- start:3135 stop:4499 length:1365 start_codon:yes stop_codon:yes gene_type:complete
MASYAIQFRRGTAAEHGSFTGLVGEVTVNTTRNSLHVHDGSTAGGTELATKASVDNLSSDSIIDADSDTHVKVEASTDSDEILFTAGGTAVMKMTSGALLPMVNSNGSTGFDLGATNAQWKDLYVSSGSLYVNGQKVLQDDSGTIVVSADADQSLTTKTTGTGQTTMQSAAGNNITSTGSADITLTVDTGEINLVGDVVIQQGKTISTSNSSALVFSDPVSFSSTVSGITNIANDLTISGGGDLVVTGNLTVSGTQTIVNTETLTVDDNIIILNNNASGTPTENAGIEIERGDSTNKQLLWDESNDYWSVGSDTFVAGLFSGAATSARYADLAERYEADAQYDAGTVVVFGGDKEVTMANGEHDHRVAGVISSAPAYMMNSEAGDDATHPYVALTGRVPCKVTGEVFKGDLLVTSAMAGHAMADNTANAGHMIGKALEDFNGESGVIEVLVNLM